MPLKSSVERDHASQRRIERRRDAQLDPGLACRASEVAELDQLERLDGLARDPEAVPRLERLRPAAGRRRRRVVRIRSSQADSITCTRRARSPSSQRSTSSSLVVARSPRTSRAGSRAGTSRAAGGACRSPTRALVAQLGTKRARSSRPRSRARARAALRRVRGRGSIRSRAKPRLGQYRSSTASSASTSGTRRARRSASAPSRRARRRGSSRP